MDNEMIDGFLHDPELPDGWNLPQDVDGGERVEDAATRGDEEIGASTLHAAQLRQPSAAAAGRGIEAAHVARAVADDGERVRHEVGQHDLTSPLGVRVEDLHVHALGGDVQSALGAFEGDQAPIAASVLDADRAAQGRLDGLALEVEERLRRGEDGAQAGGRRK